jgi:SSS family solute:Na+ symporter
VQRLLISKSAKITAKGTFYSGLFSVPFFIITGSIGLVALSVNPALDANLALPYMIKTVLPIGVSGIVIAAIISIIMSSADSFLNSASVAIVNDVLLVFKKNAYQDKLQLKIVKLTNLIVGLLAVLFALKIESVLDILIYSYNFWAPIMLVPLVSGIIGVKVSKNHFYAGLIGGIFMYALSALLLSKFISLDNIIFGVIGNFIFFYGYHFLCDFFRSRI